MNKKAPFIIQAAINVLLKEKGSVTITPDDLHNSQPIMVEKTEDGRIRVSVISKLELFQLALQGMKKQLDGNALSDKEEQAIEFCKKNMADRISSLLLDQANKGLLN